MKSIQNKAAGVVLCAILALPAWILGQYFPLVGAPVFAILLGMIVGSFYHNRTKTAAGIAFTSKYILQTAVVLLGFGLNLMQVVKVGVQSLPIIISTIATSLIVAFCLQKWLKLDVNTATLVGVGSSICGGSAIAATAPVIKAKDEEVAKSISVIFLFNIFAALIFPTLGDMLGLTNHGFALFAGTAVNDTSSVTATAAAWDAIHHSNTLDGATIVKLTRTLAIIPITLVLSFYTAFKESKNGRASEKTFSLKKAFPMFVLYFLLASIVTTVVSGLGMSVELFEQLKVLSKFFIVMAMGAIGLNTNPIKLVKTGGQAIGVGAACWIAITCVSLLMQHVLGIW
ncbi:YeiH family putative sulfate export transporter [Streptococcus equinus]|uniref:YeiH family protein n=1 Tax=Streptococcus equinus TaxID=1335 RepID=UPI00106FA674|nr:YeiH family protein [Streptococcus equinus]TFH44906.1 YeiH family putative sulfate export transporter [Streptococcus equinus]